MKKTIFWFALIFPLMLSLWLQFSGYDLKIEDLFFNHQTNEWIMSHEEGPFYRWYLYYLPKWLLAALAIFYLGRFVLSFKKENFKKYRRSCLQVLISLAVVPLLIGFLKAHTHISCPYDLNRYDGKENYYVLFEPHKEYSSGYCFPAGHASGGLSLVSLFYAMPNKILAGTILFLFSVPMGAFQTVNGAHFP